VAPRKKSFLSRCFFFALVVTPAVTPTNTKIQNRVEYQRKNRKKKFKVDIGWKQKEANERFARTLI
jgi:hypothetical protein